MNFSRVEILAVERGYSITPQGELINPRGKVVRGKIDGWGYRHTVLKRDGRSKTLRFHRLQAYTKFGEAIYTQGLETRHLDSNPANNAIDNIGLGTHQQNMDDVPRERLGTGGSNRQFDHDEFRRVFAKTGNYSETARRCGATVGTVWVAINGYRKTQEAVA